MAEEVMNMDRRTFIAVAAAAAANFALAGCAAAPAGSSAGTAASSTGSGDSAASSTAASSSATSASTASSTESSSSGTRPAVYFTRDISAAGLVAAYEALGFEAAGKVAVKISTGEPGGHNFLQPKLIKRLVKRLDATIVECCTAYGGDRGTPKSGYQVAVDHGFTAIADVDIMDSEGATEIPTPAGSVHLSSDLVGSHLDDYDTVISLAHFKGHAMGGFGGAIKNCSIGIASRAGKMRIHSAGESDDSWGGADQDSFLESMAEAAGAVFAHSNMAFVNVMNNLSVDCDCDSSPADPDMADIGILASLDPVALDRACVDLVYDAPDGASVIRRIESRNGTHTLDHAAELGLGSLEYDLVSIDG